MFKKYIPSKELQPYIAFYGIIPFKKKEINNGISEFFLPIGHGYMGFHSSDSFYLIQDEKAQDLPKFFTVGQMTQNYHINSSSDFVELIVTIFTPTGLWHFFGLDMKTIANKAIETKSLFKNNLEQFTEKFISKQTSRNRIKLIENILIKKFLEVQPQLNIIDSAIKIINQSYGCCSIKEITIELGVSERYFQKKFKNMVGITPIAYKRIVRFNFIFDEIIFDEIKSESPVDCKELIDLFNYYDFAHFSKDFKKFSGLSPSKFHIGRFNFLQELGKSKVLLGDKV